LENGTEERNRVAKVLEDANVKIGNVLADVFGMSGQAMLEALLENKLSAEQMANLAHRRLRPKIPQIVEALEGHRMSDHHRLLIGQALKHMQFIEDMVEELNREIRRNWNPTSGRLNWLVRCQVLQEMQQQHSRRIRNRYERSRTVCVLSSFGLMGRRMSWKQQQRW